MIHSAAILAGVAAASALGSQTAPTEHSTQAAAAPATPSMTASSPEPSPAATLNAQPRLVAESTALIAGETAFVGVTFKIEPHWHLYWRGQNTAGMAPSITWGLPKGISVGETQWPAPERKLQPGADDIVSYIYEDQVTLIVPVSVAPELAGSTVTMHAAMEWLVCAEGCVLESATATLTLPVVAKGQTLAASPDAPLFKATRARLPQSWTPANDAVRVKIDGNLAKIDAKDAVSIAFHPDEAGVTIVNAPATGASKTGSLDMEFEASATANELIGIVEVLRKGDSTPAWYTIRVPAPRTGVQSPGGLQR